MAAITQQQAEETRRRYVEAWNDTMVDLWCEQIAILKVIDTGALYDSVQALSTRADGRIVDITFESAFLRYGLYQDYGTGKEVYRGNLGDIGRDKVRTRRRWYSRKYWSSVMRLKDFMQQNLGDEFVGIVSDAWKRL